MAFRAPQAAPQRHITQSQRPQLSRSTSLHRPLDQSQEWVLFSPSTYSHTASVTEATPRTTGASRLSDSGSLASVLPPSQEGAVAAEDGDVDDLDSLDDGLHEFREHFHASSGNRNDIHGGTILPNHDGLGSFQASGPAVQEQLWQHERFNPRRQSLGHHRRTTSSIHRRLDAINDEYDKEHPFMEGEKLDQVERWRLDQSRVMLEEVRRETQRRRRLSLNPSVTSQVQSISAVINPGAVSDKASTTTEQIKLPSTGAKESESFWQRITRRVIKDFMGIDDSLLSVILGETIPEDDLLSTTPKAITPEAISNELYGVEQEQLVAGWEDRLLKRLAKELKTIVSNLSDRPDTPSTRFKSDVFDYAGIPIKSRTHPTIPETEELELGQTPKAHPNPSILFSPTLRQAQESLEVTEHEAGWGIEDSHPTVGAPMQEDLDYWERTPDLRQVFAYLSRRFLNRADGSLPPPASLASMVSAASPTAPNAAAKSPSTMHSRSSIATHSTPDSLRRAAIIRQHHPLVRHAHEARLASQRRLSQHQRHSSLRSIALDRPAAAAAVAAVAASDNGLGAAVAAAAALSEIRSLKRVGDDCASQSTKRSKTSRSRKHYWDMGSDSAAATFGAMGSWGAV